MHIVDVIDWITDREDLNELEDLQVVVKEQIRQVKERTATSKTLINKGSQRYVWGIGEGFVWGISPNEIYDDPKNGTL